MRCGALVLSMAVLLGACGGQGNGRRTADTLGVAPVRPIGATAAPPATSPAHPLTGTWHLARVQPRSGAGPGIMVSLTIDSVRDDTVYGRLAHYMAGNAGGDVSAWGPLTGTVRGDFVRLRVPGDGDRVGDLAFAGLLAADTIRLSRFAVGPDDLAAGEPARWVLARDRER